MNDTTGKREPAILVTGATGLSGSLVVRELARREIPVRVLVRNREKAKMLEQYPLVRIYEGDMLQPDSLGPALEGADKALLISSAAERMTETQQTFIDAARKAGVRHITKYSGGDSGIGFLSHKFVAQKEHEDIEEYLVRSGLQWTILRPSQFMQMYLPGAVTGVNLVTRRLSLPIGKGKLSPVDIEDVARVCAALLTENGHEHRVYEMTGPDALDMDEACDIIAGITGLPFRYEPLSMDAYEQGLLEKGFPPGRVRILTEISQQRAKCLESHIKLDTHRRFGVRPTNFAEFIYRNRQAFV